MSYNTLAFTIHRKCSASCSMCCFESTPTCTEKLNRKKILEYIKESGEIPEIKTISFTGGEPFLTFNDLVELIDSAKKVKKRVTTITNGYWADSFERAYNKLKVLKDVGLDHLSISHDSYHKEYVKTEYVKNILNAAVQLEIPTTLAMVVVKNEKIGNIIDELGDGLYGPEIEIIPCLPSGGACKTFKDEQFDRKLSINNLRCIYNGNIVVTYSGDIFPCCSQMVMETGLKVGNYNNMSLKEALKLMKNNGLLYLLRNDDFDYLIEVSRKELGIELPDKVVNVCELCSILLEEKNINRLRPHIVNRVRTFSKKGN